MARILLIEDSMDTAALVTWRLTQEGFEVLHEADGAPGLKAAAREAPALVILDWQLPGMDGLEVCRRLRQLSDRPILMLTAHGGIADRVRGLDSGATDYLPKPFDVEELVARVKAQLRLASPEPRSRYEIADLVLDARRYEVSRGGEPIALTPKEFELLRCLVGETNRVVPRERLLERVWGHDFEGGDGVLDVFIATLRKKVDRPGRSKLIHTIRGVGYLLRCDG